MLETRVKLVWYNWDSEKRGDPTSDISRGDCHDALWLATIYELVTLREVMRDTRAMVLLLQGLGLTWSRKVFLKNVLKRNTIPFSRFVILAACCGDKRKKIAWSPQRSSPWYPTFHFWVINPLKLFQLPTPINCPLCTGIIV